MSVKGIIDRIISDAQREAEEIIGEAKHQATSIKKENEREADEYHQRRKVWLDEKYRKEKERSVLNRRLQQRKSILASRQNWMDKAFSEAYRKLVDQPIQDYKDLMKKLIMRVSTTKSERIIFGKKGEKKDLQSIVKELNREKKGNFSLSDKRGDFPWGFILQKGKIETNMSIESLFKYKRNDLEQKAWELFNATIKH